MVFMQDGPQRDRLKTLIANSETDQKIYKAGFLNKTGGGRKGLKRWKRRWVYRQAFSPHVTATHHHFPVTCLGIIIITIIINCNPPLH